jgi:hypothetical protein
LLQQRLARAQLPDCVVGVGGKSNKKLRIRWLKSACRGFITDGGGGAG